MNGYDNPPTCCGGTGIGCACGIQPVVQLCAPSKVPAFSRAFGIPVSSEDDPDGRHDPACGGCYGTADGDTCPYSMRLRAYTDRLGITEGSPSGE